MKLLGKGILALIGMMATTGFAADVSPFDLDWANAPTRPATYNSADYEGAIFVLEVFQNNCGPCNQNAHNVDDLSAEYADTDYVQVLDVGIGQSPRSLAQWIARHNPNHPVLSGTSELMTQLGIEVTPTTVVVDCDMNIRWENRGVWSEQVKTELRTLVNQLQVECSQ